MRLALLALTGGKVDNLEHIAQQALEALAIIAMSYRVRIDREDIPPYIFAQDILDKLGVDLEITTRHIEQALAYVEKRGQDDRNG